LERSRLSVALPKRVEAARERACGAFGAARCTASGTRGLGRRSVLALLAGAAVAWPQAARAQASALPVIGFLSSQYPEGFSDPLRGFRQGLKESGYVDGENVAIDFRWAENRIDRLPQLAADLVRRRVAAIAAMDSTTALAVKSATATIPVVFNTGEDPIRRGLVASLSRPGGNLTGVHFFSAELAPKRLGLLRQLLPAATRIAVLVNPDHATITEATLRDVDGAANATGFQVEVFKATNGPEVDAAFAALSQARLDALLLGSGPFFNSRRVQLALLAGRYGVPTIFTGRQYVEAGGLMSYGASLSDAWRQIGDYSGRILKGVKPADLPVVQAAKFELVINGNTARMLGLTVPPSLLAIADGLIE
jgi:putative ABC transport system substrate-binding protein